MDDKNADTVRQVPALFPPACPSLHGNSPCLWLLHTSSFYQGPRHCFYGGVSSQLQSAVFWAHPGLTSLLLAMWETEGAEASPVPGDLVQMQSSLSAAKGLCGELHPCCAGGEPGALTRSALLELCSWLTSQRHFLNPSQPEPRSESSVHAASAWLVSSENPGHPPWGRWEGITVEKSWRLQELWVKVQTESHSPLPIRMNATQTHSSHMGTYLWHSRAFLMAQHWKKRNAANWHTCCPRCQKEHLHFQA